MFPLRFGPEAVEVPFAFYTFDFETRRLPAPPAPSLSFDVLFILPSQPRSAVAIQLSLFILQVSEDVAAVSTDLTFRDLTYRVDHNNVFGVLQFRSPGKHEKVQMEATFYEKSTIATNPRTLEATFYLTMGRQEPLSTYVVDDLMGQIKRGVRCV